MVRLADPATLTYSGRFGAVSSVSDPFQSLSFNRRQIFSVFGAVAAEVFFGASALARNNSPNTAPRYTNLEYLPASARQALLNSNALFGNPPDELQRNRTRGREAIDTLNLSLNCVSLDEFMRLEGGKRLGSSGRNILHIPSGKAANFDIGRFHEEGAIVFAPGLPVTGPAGVEGYVRTIADYYGRPVIVIINDENGLFRRAGDPRGMNRPSALLQIPYSVGAVAVGKMSTTLGTKLEPSAKTVARALSQLASQDVRNVLALGHSQGTVTLSIGLTHLIRTNGTMSPRVLNNFSFEVVASVETQWPAGTKLLSWGYNGDPLMRIGGIADKAIKPFHRERFSRGGETIRLAGRSHDFDVCVQQDRGNIAILQALANGATPEVGRDLAFSVIEGIARAQLGDLSYNQLFEIMAANLNDPTNGRFARSFACHIRMFCPEGRIGRYTVPAGSWNVLQAAR